MALQPQFETGLVGNMGLKYNIQMAQASDGVWYQRHIWHNDGRQKFDPPLAQDWIVSLQVKPDHMKAIEAICEKADAAGWTA